MRSTLICFMFLINTTSFSQKNKQSIAGYTSFFNSGSSFSKSIGGSSINVKRTFLIGAEYSKPLNKWLRINGGIEFSNHTVLETSAPMPNQLVTEGHIQFVSIPVYFQANLLKYFFFTFGTILDLQGKNDFGKTYSGIGITGGTGFKYDFNNNLSIFIHPFYQVHGLSSGQNNIINGGLRTGIGFGF